MRAKTIVVPLNFLRPAGTKPGTDVIVGGNDWNIYPEDADQLRNLIDRLTEKV